jgi:hypothetical protein
MTLKLLTEHLKSPNRNPMHSCFGTSVIFWIEKGLSQTETELWRKTNRLTSPSPLLPLSRARIVEKESIEAVHGLAAARVVRVKRYATNSGMENEKRAKIIPVSASRNPNLDLALPKRIGRRVRAMGGPNPHQHPECQRKRWQRSFAHTFNRAIVAMVTNVFTNVRKQLLPLRIRKKNNSTAPKKKASAKAAPCITKRYACIAKGKGLPNATKAMKDQSQRALLFSSKVEYIKIPAAGEQHKAVHRLRMYNNNYPTSESVPKPDKLVAHRAQVIARQL